MNSFSFNGVNKKSNYFEGWYIHLLDNEKKIAYAFIFGISLYEKDKHAFIQIIDKNVKEPFYFRFDINDFYYNNDSIKIKDNILSPTQVVINEGPFDIDLSISGLNVLENNLLTPGAMGLIKYLPIPTHIEIIFLDSLITGTINQEDFSGSAYMEKNWGSRFPNKWIWIESNNFSNNNTSFVMAYANLFANVDGFFAILKIDGEELRFATYNGFKTKVITSNKNNVVIEISKRDLTLKVEVDYKDEYKLVAPVKYGNMTRIISESLNSDLKISLYRNNKLIYSDTAKEVACENTYHIN
jgi:hypothetical protein